MQFEFATASKIIFGSGSSKKLPELTAQLGNKVCLVIGGSPKRARWAIDSLTAKGLSPHVVTISGEPDTDTISHAADGVRQAGCDVVVAIGGGSVLDAGKALAALLTNQSDLFEYLEVVGKGLPLTKKPAPFIAVPTTAGTGSEVTSNAVLLSPKHGMKVSMRSADMIPNIAIIDPKLTLSVPPAVTAATGMDALTQLMEAFVSNRANPITDSLCREGMMRAAGSIRPAHADGTDLTAREDMALASLLSGIVLANAKLGAVHGFAAPLGGEFKAPHGAVCACLLPHVMEMNVKALKERDPHSEALHAYAEITIILTGDIGADIEDCITWIKDLCQDLQIPGLKEMGVKKEDFAGLVEKAANTSSMKGNPVELHKEELIKILEKAF
jgi:alcohol dehydrogenase class IV